MTRSAICVAQLCENPESTSHLLLGPSALLILVLESGHDMQSCGLGTINVGVEGIAPVGVFRSLKAEYWCTGLGRTGNRGGRHGEMRMWNKTMECLDYVEYCLAIT